MVLKLQALAHIDSQFIPSHFLPPHSPSTLHLSILSQCTFTSSQAHHFPFMLLPHPHQACVPPCCVPKFIPPSNNPFHPHPTLTDLSSLASHYPYTHNLRTMKVCIHPSTRCSLHSAYHPLHRSAKAFPPHSLLHSQSSSLSILLVLHLSNLRITSAHYLGSSHLSFHPSFLPTCA